MCLCTRAMVCIYASAYVGRIREWNPRIHSLECEVCVLSSPERGMSPKLTVTTLSGMTRVRVLWVTAGDGCVLMLGAPQGPVGHHHMCSRIQIHTKNTHTVTCLSPPQHGSNVCVLIGVCFISARKRERVSLLRSMGLSFFFVQVVFWQPLAGAHWCSTQICSFFVKLCNPIWSTRSYLVLSLSFSFCQVYFYLNISTLFLTLRLT